MRYNITIEEDDDSISRDIYGYERKFWPDVIYRYAITDCNGNVVETEGQYDTRAGAFSEALDSVQKLERR